MKIYDAQGRLIVVSSVANLDDIGDVNSAAPTDGNVLYWDAATSTWKDKASMAPAAHALGGAAHSTDTWANFKTKVSDDTPLAATDVDDTPVDGQTAVPPSSNWAYDHNARDATALVQGHATAAQITKLDGIAAGAQPGTVTAVSGTSPVTSSGGTTPAIGIPAATAAAAGHATAAQITKLDGIEALADVTDATNVAAAGAVMDADFTAADEVMVGTGAGTHGQVTLAASQFLAKKATGTATNVTVAEAKTMLGAGAASGLATLNASSKVVEQPASISDFLEASPTNGVSTKAPDSNWAYDHVAAADPHTGYRLETADHTHQSTGAQAGQLDHGLALTGLTDDDHTQYRLESADHTHQSTGLQGGQLDHGLALTGLTDDDHTQYLLKQMVENDPLLLDAAISGDGYYSGICEAGTAGATLVFGNLCYLAVADSRWELADANTLALANAKLGICVLAAASNGSATRMLLFGKVNAASLYPALTIGAKVYVGETAGNIQVAAPTGDTDIIRVIGFANTADELFFYPDNGTENALDDTSGGNDGAIYKAATANALFDTMTAHGAAADPHAGYILESLLTEQGDVIYASGVSTPAALAHGTAGQVLRSGGHGANPSWLTPTSNVITITFIIDGGGAAITTGQKGHLEIPFACTLTAYTLMADVAGAIVIDVWKDTYANFPPTDADAMPGANKEPTIAATNQKAQDTDISDWAAVAITAGDILAFNVDSCTTITRVTLSLKATKT